MMEGTDMMMGYWSVWHWFIFVALVALVLYPIGRILSRIGFSPFWSVIALIPLANLIGLWIIALAVWPQDKRAAR